jgi:hypothetical protein
MGIATNRIDFSRSQNQCSSSRWIPRVATGDTVIHMRLMCDFCPTLLTWAVQQVVSYLGYTGRAANVIVRAAIGRPGTP